MNYSNQSYKLISVYFDDLLNPLQYLGYLDVSLSWKRDYIIKLANETYLESDYYFDVDEMASEYKFDRVILKKKGLNTHTKKLPEKELTFKKEEKLINVDAISYE